MTRKNNSDLKCFDVARAIFGEPAKPWGIQPEPEEAYFLCNQHHDEHPSLKVSQRKPTWMCGPCGAGGNPWELAGFGLGKGCKWELYSEADRKEIADWLRAHGLLADLPEKKQKRPRTKRETGNPILREFIYRDWNTGKPLALRLRFDVPPEKRQEAFKWFHPAVVKGADGEKPEWWAGYSGVNQLPPYLGLPQPKDEQTFREYVKAFKASTEVLFTEGEHDADAAASLGLLTATCGGTSSSENLRRNLEYFRGKDVVIVAHPGAKELEYAEKAAAILYGAVKSVRIVKPNEFWSVTFVKDLADIVEAISPANYTADAVRHAYYTARHRAPEWKPAAGAQVLDKIYNFIRRFISAREAQARVLTLWVVHTHTFRVAKTTPYLHIFSPGELCGKSQLLEVLEVLARDAFMVAGGTPPYIRRRIAQEPPPALLLDEIENLFKGEPEIVAMLHAYINSGYRESGRWGVSEKIDGAWQPVEMSTFCPKAIAGSITARIAGTIRTRALPIRLDRKIEELEDWDNEEIKGEAAILYRELSAWCETVTEQIAKAPRVILKELTDRQKQMTRQLFTICELAGGVWATQGPKAIIELCREAQKETVTLQYQFLEALLDLFFPLDEDGRCMEMIEQMPSSTMAFRLAEMDGLPFARYPGTGRPVTQGQIAELAGMFQTFDNLGSLCKIQSRLIYSSDGSRVRGYKAEQFAEAWKHYCKMLYLEHLPTAEIGTAGTPEAKLLFHAIPADTKALIQDGTDGTDGTPPGICEKRFMYCGFKVERAKIFIDREIGLTAGGGGNQTSHPRGGRLGANPRPCGPTTCQGRPDVLKSTIGLPADWIDTWRGEK